MEELINQLKILEKEMQILLNRKRSYEYKERNELKNKIKNLQLKINKKKQNAMNGKHNENVDDKS